MKNSQRKIIFNYQFIVLGIFLAAGTLVTTRLYFNEQILTKNTAINEFNIAAQERYAAFSLILKVGMKTLDSLKGFYYSSKEVEREEFEIFSQTILKDQSSIKALGWIPTISSDRKAEFENTLISEGFSNFRITERNSLDEIITAGKRDLYYPITYIEPMEGNERAFGYDLGSEVIRYEALMKSRDSDEMSISGKIYLDQGDKRKSAVLIFLPIHKSDDSLGSILDRKGRSEGFVTGVFMLDDIYNTSLKIFESQDINTYIFDVTNEDDPKFLYGNNNGFALDSTEFPPEIKFEELRNKNNLINMNLSLGGRNWLMIFEPGEKYFLGSHARHPIFILILGYIMTLILCFWLFNRFKYINKIEDEIYERTLIEKSLTKSLNEIKDLKFALDEHSIVAITDQHGIINYVNDKFSHLSQYSKAELLGEDHKILNSKYHSKEFMRDLWKTIMSGKVWRGEIKNKAKDGSYFWLGTTIVPFLNDQGDPYQYIAIRTDITERKLNEDCLRAVNDELLDKIKESEKLNKSMTGRELRIIEIKREVNKLSEELGKPSPYKFE